MTAILSVRIIGDATPAKQALSETDAALGKTEDRVTRFNNAMEKAAVPAGLLIAAVGKLAADSFEAASSLEQSTGAVEAVFGAQADAVKALAQQASSAVGLAQSDYQELAAVLGSQLGNMGVAGDQIAGQTDDLISLGADLAAQFGGSTADAVAALSSLMRGERDPIEKYGVSISAAAIEAQKAEMGLSGLTGEADRAATTQATLALLTEQTAAAQGAFAREADTAAGAQQRASAAWEDAQAALGTALLPVVAEAATHLAELSEWVQENSETVTILVAVIAGLAAGVLAYNAIMAALPAIQAIATAAQWAWNAAMSANPIGLVILAIAALIAIIVLLVRNWDTVREVAGRVWNSIVQVVSTAASAVGNWISNLISWVSGIPSAIGGAFQSGVNAAVGAFQWLQRTVINAIQGIYNWLAGIPGRIASAFNVRIPSWVSTVANWLFAAPPAEMMTALPPYPTAEQLLTFATSTVAPTSIRTVPAQAAGGDQIEININGGMIDAKTIDKLVDALNQRARSRGKVPANQVVYL